MNGSCLCGRITFVVAGEPLGVNYCHCQQCRKASGTAFATNAGFAREQFTVLSGADDIQGFESSPGKQRHFCRHCGSPLYSSSTRSPEVIYLRVGSLDDDAAIRPDVHIHVDSKAAWYTICDSLPQRRAEEDLWF